MQGPVESEFVCNKLSFVVIVLRTVRNFPVHRRLERRRNGSRMAYVVLEQVLAHSRAGERIAVAESQRPLAHLVLAHLRWKPRIERSAPVETAAEVIAPVREFWEPHLVGFHGILVVHAVARRDSEKVIRQNLQAEGRTDVREIKGIRRKVVRNAVTRGEESPVAVLVFYRLRGISLRGIGLVAHHLQVLQVQVVAQGEPDGLLFPLVRGLPQMRVRREVLHRVNLGCVRVRHARGKDVAQARETPDFRDPDTVKFGVGGKAVVVVVRELTVGVVLRV